MSSIGRSCRTFRQAKIDLGRESEGGNLPARPANNPVFVHHHMSPFISLHLHCTHPVICSCTVTKKTHFSSYQQQNLLLTYQEQFFFTYHTYQSPSRLLVSRTPRQQYSPAHVSLHPWRRSSYRTSYRNPVAANPSGRHTLETGTTKSGEREMQRALCERKNISSSRSQACSVHAAIVNEGMGSKTRNLHNTVVTTQVSA